MKLQWLVYCLSWGVLQTPAQVIAPFSLFKADGTIYTEADLPKNHCSFFLFVDPSCDHCQKAIGSFNKQYHSFSNTNILIVSLSNHKSMQDFLASHAPGLSAKKNVVTLQDRQNSFITLFGPRKYPGMFLYSKNHRLLDYEDDGENIFRFALELKKETNAFKYLKK